MVLLSLKTALVDICNMKNFVGLQKAGNGRRHAVTTNKSRTTTVIRFISVICTTSVRSGTTSID